VTPVATRVLIADDHALARAGVGQTLADAGFDVVAEASDAPSAVAAAEREQPDLCLLDVHMPGSGIRAAGEIVQRLPETAVVMLTVSRNDEDLFDALRAGAAGYLLKDTDPERLPHALRGVLAGEAAIPRALVARVIDEFRSHGRRRRVPLPGRRGIELSSREWEVLDLLREGLTTAEIGRRLFVSPITVRRHVSAILHKLDVPDRQAAVALLEEKV
jgi:DNA-binding NarL/FixJ family response regulator